MLLFNKYTFIFESFFYDFIYDNSLDLQIVNLLFGI